ncbi:cytochrome c-type biogenesis protein CcmH [Paraconexibacter sp.]|uniref:cytochrome c-type biogenesis protein n=1 Tax=Paraconexibacter sp. TaxID=2949640 RepID=UPI003563ADBE
MTVRRVLLVVLAALCVLPSASLAATPKTSLIDIEDEVMCVTCNVALNIAESPQAASQRREIQRLVEEGLTKQQVKDRLVEQYGPRVLALPKGDGFEITVYLVPIAVVLGLLAAAAVLLPRWRAARRRAPAGDGLDVATLDEADSARLDAELSAFDR